MKISEREIENLKNKCNIIITDKQALKEIIADNLRELRNKKHLTQEVVAEIVGLTRQSVSRHEQMIDIPDITNLNETPRSKLRGISPRLTSFVISLLRSKLRGIKPSLGLNYVCRRVYL